MRRPIVLVTLLAAVIWTALQSPAAAASSGIELDVGGTGFSANPSASLISISRMVPGASGSGVLGVRNTTSNQAALSLEMVDVHASENGCTHPERAMPSGCDPDGRGQLGDALRFSIGRASSKSGPYAATWTGTVADLRSGVMLGAKLAANGTEWIRLTIELPESTGNGAQSDTFGFDLRVVLSGPGAASFGSSFGVAGVSTVRGVSLGSGASGSGGLSFTGVPMLFMIGAGLLLVLSGALIAAVYRDRRGWPEPRAGT